ncbi:hypothetical protein Cpir12675_004829 [Ceratocystis pirilliformis]|uniref:RING zinc finger-like domain-containing protein n=1 Tax=Ceratocystis pirilliformis TaxID=259994 RepID=A0ABR3YTS9_9PEZI
MPPRAPLTSTFPASEPTNEIICPLTNQDGSQCRKRCIGEKRYRSMQEHIRRAHPDNYIAKLPATEASFNMMVNKRAEPTSMPSTSISASYQSLPPSSYDSSSGYPHVHAASALAGLHRVERDWDNDSVRSMPTSFPHSGSGSDSGNWREYELPPITSQPSSSKHTDLPKPRELLPSNIINSSPPSRSTTLPPLMTPLSAQKPRKYSYTRHRHQRSRNGATLDSIKKLQFEDHRVRKAYSAEPSADDASKRWVELITAAGHAADLDSVSAPQSPVSIQHESLAPTSVAAPSFHHQTSHYQASPLQQALTPPTTYAQDSAEPFPSVETGDSAGSPPVYQAQNTQIYCGACHKVSLLRQSYACTECISGFCSPCVQVMVNEKGAKRTCPKCSTIGGRFKPIQLEIR